MRYMCICMCVHARRTATPARQHACSRDIHHNTRACAAADALTSLACSLAPNTRVREDVAHTHAHIATHC